MTRLHNQIRRATNLQRAVRDIVGEDQVEQFNGLERVGETLTPVLDPYSIDHPERNYLRDEVIFSAYHAQAAVVGELSFVGIRNPAGSGLLVTIDDVDARVGTATTCSVYHGTTNATDVDGSEQVVPRDTRYNVAGVTAILKFHGAGVAAIGNDALENRYVGISGQTFFAGRRILRPGFDLRYYVNVANIELYLNVVGRVRRAFPGELRLS